MAYTSALSGKEELEAAKRQLELARAKVAAKAEAERLARERKAAGGGGAAPPDEGAASPGAGPNKAVIVAGVVGVVALAAYLLMKK